jgi:hypothetical protein
MFARQLAIQVRDFRISRQGTEMQLIFSNNSFLLFRHDLLNRWCRASGSEAEQIWQQVADYQAINGGLTVRMKDGSEVEITREGMLVEVQISRAAPRHLA